VEPATGEISPASRSTSEKITLLLESKSIAKDDLGRWLRENGLHSEHLPEVKKQGNWISLLPEIVKLST
jgi:hypothetical protein